MARRMLARQGADARISGNLYKAVVQSILLYGSETWVLTTPMVKVLAGFHHRVIRQIAGMLPKYDARTYKWSKPPISQAYEATGVDRSNISKTCNGTQGTAGGYRWKFKHEDEEVGDRTHFDIG